ncbi:unnamed protein product [Sphagnum balticum]
MFSNLSTSESDKVNLMSGIETLARHSPYKNESWHDHLQFPLPPDQDCKKMWTSYYTFFATRSWFRRAWLQEVVLASRMSLLLPGWSASRESILFLEEILQLTGWKNELTSFEGVPSSHHWKDVSLLRTLSIVAQEKPLWASQGDLTVDVDFVTRADAPDKPVRSIFGKVRFSSALLTPGAMIGHLLMRGRIYNSTFDVDKINAILGIANKILVSLGDSELHLATTPSDTVERVYIDISRLVIEKSTHLSLLRDVESQEMRKRHSLPSWVPDFSVQMYKNNTSVFDVWHDDPPKPGLMPNFTEDRMIPFASEIRIVQEVFNAPYVSIESAHSHLGPFLLTIASIMSPVYQPTNESRLEAILRMMLDCPKHAEARQWSQRQFGRHFPSFLSLLAYMGQFMPFKWGHAGEEKTATMQQLLVVLPDWTRHGISGGEMRLLREMLYIRDQCLFLTETGYIGKAMKGVQKSDSVMIFERATVPFVVRKLPAGSQSALNRFTRFLSSLWPRNWHAYISCRLTRFLWNVLPNKRRLAGLEKYTFVGDSYVHGVMWGELVTPSFRQTFTPICLV